MPVSTFMSLARFFIKQKVCTVVVLQINTYMRVIRVKHHSLYMTFSSSELIEKSCTALQLETQRLDENVHGGILQHDINKM